jgi:putative ABC transport system permease protein
MLLHYIKVALRNLSKQKILAFINIFGLSAGIACFSLFLLYAVNEFSYDRFHQKGAQIYRVIDWFTGDKDREPGGDASSYTPLGPAMKQDLPDVLNFVRFQDGRELFVKVNNKVARIQVSFADPQLLNVFSFKLINGNPDYALRDPHSIVLTREKAMQLFGNTNIVGKRVDVKMDDRLEQFEGFTVGGVVEDIPSTSSIQFDILGNFQYVLNGEDGKASAQNWHMTIGINTFVELRKGSQLASNNKQMAAFRHKYYADEEADMKKLGRWNGTSTYPFSFRLQSLKDIHTTVNVDSGPPGSTTDPKNIWILIGIAAGILLIACINFTTLAIGRSAGRAKEVGLRKVIGSGTKRLIFQFLTESMVLSIFSGIFGLVLANLLLPSFNQLCGKQLNFSINQFPEMLWALVALIVLVGLLAGSYPAFVLSGFKPVQVLKTKIKLGGSNIFTKTLVTFQFVLSIGLIISTLIIFRQLNFLRSTYIGLNKENVIVVDANGLNTKRVYPLFKQSLSSQKQVVGVGAAEIGLGEGEGQMGDSYNFGDKSFGSIEYPVDHEYIKIMGMQLIAGRNFNPSLSSDSVSSIIINQTLANAQLGLSAQEAVGRQLKTRDNKMMTIIGVIRDFNFEALNRHVRAQLFTMPADFAPTKFFVRIQAGDPASALTQIQSVWKNTATGFPFKFSFLDEDLDRFYKSEQKWSEIVGWAGGISIFLAALGLFGLAALAGANRSKEVGIRKVLGASIFSIVNLLSRDFLKLVLLAILIASPIAWLLMSKWLQNYAYQIKIGWWVFGATGIFCLMIAFITIGFQAIKTGIANPVKTLRTD